MIARTAGVLSVVLMGGFLYVMPAAAEGNDDSAAVTPASRSALPLLRGLEPQVEFWKRIFGNYSTREVVIHDALHLDRIYEVLDFESLSDNGMSDAEIAAYAREKTRSEKERIRGILMRLHQLGADPGSLAPEERKIWALFADVNNPSKFIEAAADDRIRSQAGLRERFAAGVEVSRRYLPEMEAIFRRAGLPIELTRLPLVESCFNVRAYSKVGAAGIWQFMPATARLYMRVDRVIDERRDPIASTRAAAEYLQRSYEVLGNWPLAVTAYNHGRAGVANGVSTVGSSDLMHIIRNYHGPAFKFASRNFYAEFLAALEVERNFSKYFGTLYPVRPRPTENIVVPAAATLKSLARATRADVDTLADLNPALAREVVSGRVRVPKGYHLRVPSGTAGQVQYASATDDEERHAQKPQYRVQKAQYVVYRVKRGQTLSTIAKRYRTTVAAIRRHNRLRADHVHVGQSLKIPTT